MNRRKLLLGMGLASAVLPLSMRVARADESKDNSEHIFLSLSLTFSGEI